MELVLRAVLVQRGVLNEHQSYVASLLFGDIARLLDVGCLYVPNDPELPDFAQRKPNPVRVKTIAQYILETYEDGSTFFPAICLNVQPRPIYRDGSIVLPYHSVSLRLTDGQHRCFGIRQALKNVEDDPIKEAALAQLELGALIYAGLPLEQERQAFRDQNLLVQRPSVSLAHTFDQRSPTVLIARVLLDLVPQFSNNVEMVENGLGKHNPKLMTFSTLVTATQHMFPNLRSRNNLESRSDWATTFWTVVASTLPDNPWRVVSKKERDRQRQETLTVTAVVIQALGLVARDLYVEGVPDEDLMKRLSRLREINWHREDPFWRERGVTQTGAKGDPIIQNTRTTVDACHRVLREFVGVVPTACVV
ncbi:MAG TPA: DNA sulfur modification protein DndB [Trichocoleus sp.]|jgi:DNA sulfur modification protein DndB